MTAEPTHFLVVSATACAKNGENLPVLLQEMFGDFAAYLGENIQPGELARLEFEVRSLDGASGKIIVKMLPSGHPIVVGDLDDGGSITLSTSLEVGRGRYIRDRFGEDEDSNTEP